MFINYRVDNNLGVFLHHNTIHDFLKVMLYMSIEIALTESEKKKDAKWNRLYILVIYGYVMDYDKTQWLKTTGIYYLNSVSQESRCSLAKSSSLALKALIKASVRLGDLKPQQEKQLPGSLIRLLGPEASSKHSSWLHQSKREEPERVSKMQVMALSNLTLDVLSHHPVHWKQVAESTPHPRGEYYKKA